MSTRFAIRHTTSFEYTTPVTETVMELRLHPNSRDRQRCLEFEIDTEPRARVFAYTDFLGNGVHHFDVPRPHLALTIVARTLVQVEAPPEVPEALPRDAWRAMDEVADRGEHWALRHPSRFTPQTPALIAFVTSLGRAASRDTDPLTTVRETMAAIHEGFEYAPASTKVDSPIEEVLKARRGVCQDFTHLMIAVLRRLGVPARYVSGYLAPATDAAAADRSSLATHAWAEVWLPELGWVGMDPTHNVPAGPGHVSVAIGRDYADVPPTRGIFKGSADGSLSVAVEIARSETLPPRGAAATRTPRAAMATPGVAAPMRADQQQQ